jgi:hypothetical protein
MIQARIVLMVCAIFTNAIVSDAQEMQDIFDKESKITWLGLDFSNARFIGDRERFGSTSDALHLIESWNDLMIKEKEKFNIARAIAKTQVEDALAVTREHNANVDVAGMFSNERRDHMRLRRDDVIAIIADYDFRGMNGTGIMFNVESFSKLDGEAAVWITFLNMDTKEVYFTERMTGKPGGFGMRNFWAGAIKDILVSIEKKEFEMWRKKYYRKY